MKPGERNNSGWRGLLVVLAVSVVIAVVGLFPFVGLPGALVLTLTAPVAGMDVEAAGPGVWGAAIWMTVIWPIAITPAWWIAFHHLKSRPIAVRLAVFLGLLYAWGVLMTLPFRSAS